MEWITLVSGAINSAINGVSIYLACRYVGRLADRIEKRSKNGETKNQ